MTTVMELSESLEVSVQKTLKFANGYGASLGELAL